MKIELDVHTHTVASGHAFSSLQEMAQAAAGKGLKLLGITEHSPVTILFSALTRMFPKPTFAP